MVRYPPPWCFLRFTQAHRCDTPFCNISRDNCAIPLKNKHGRVCDTIATSIARYEKYRCWASKALPEAIGGLLLLELLDVQQNILTGAIPRCIGHLLVLKMLFAGDNMYAGTVPSALAVLSALSHMVLSPAEMWAAVVKIR